MKKYHSIPEEKRQAAVKALEKQVLKEVRNIYPSQGKETGIYILTGDCPVCGSSVPAEQRCCGNCGQRLDWSLD
ncbi:hypothetical protein [Murimonas intestini]|uniref:hypothetical protein n=1 Tax=Murimonas intestini TaxID=1337051 RepID=UPI00248AE6D6|nr:hypothetical protein [Murimonas intestini]